jgi:ribosomal protein L32
MVFGETKLGPIITLVNINMPNDTVKRTKPAHPCDMPFPRHCPECGKAAIRPATIPYDAEVKHDGRLHAFRIPALQVNQCAACGEVLFSNVTVAKHPFPRHRAGRGRGAWAGRPR